VTSEGMNSIGQNGVTSTLESELKSKVIQRNTVMFNIYDYILIYFPNVLFQSDKIRTIIKARGISYPNVTGKTFAVFRVDKDHHLISVVSFMCKKLNAYLHFFVNYRSITFREMFL